MRAKVAMPVLKEDEKAKIDNLIDAVRSEKDLDRRRELFLTLYAECGIYSYLGEIFALRDLYFIKELKKEGINWSNKAASWLTYLSNQIDNYMEDGEDKESFREKIHAELAKASEDLLLRKKQSVMEHLDSFFSKLEDIDDHKFYGEVNNIFGNKMTAFLSNEKLVSKRS